MGRNALNFRACVLVAAIAVLCRADSARPDSATPADAPEPAVSAVGRQDLMGVWQAFAVPGDPAQAEVKATESAKWAAVQAPFLLTNLPGIDYKAADQVHYAWARREFVAPDETAFRNAALHLHGVRWGSKIWLNGKEVGEHLGAYGVFEFNITDAIRWGQKNELLVRLTGWPEIPYSAADDPTHVGKFPLVPHGAAAFGWGNRQAGISGGMWIDYFDYARLERVKIEPRQDAAGGFVGIAITGGMRNFTRQFGHRWIEPTIIGPDGAKIAGEKIEVPWANTAYRRTVFEFAGNVAVDNPKPWTLGDPTLYRLQLDLVQEGRLLNRWSERFGFRRFEARSGKPGASATGPDDPAGQAGFYLNGQRIFLRGVCTVCGNFATSAPAEKEALIRNYMVDLPRKANLNCIRNHTQPLDGVWLDVMDRGAVMLLQEFPITMNYRHPKLTADEEAIYRQRCLDEFRSLLPLYWNHPSVIAWVETNESGFDNDWENGPLYQMFKQADPTRPVIRSGEQTADVFDSHSYDGFWSGSEGQFALSVANAAKKGRETGKPVMNSEFVEGFGGGRVTKWLGPKPASMPDEAWEKEQQEFYAQLVMEQTETLRRLGYDGILPYAWGYYLGEWNPNGSRIKLAPAYDALKSAQAPLLASIDLADRHFVAGQVVQGKVVICDDRGPDRTQSFWGLGLWKDDPGLASGKFLPGESIGQTSSSMKNPRGGHRQVLDCPVAFGWPDLEPGRYFLWAEINDEGEKVFGRSRRVLDFIAAPDFGRLAGRKIAVFASDNPADHLVADLSKLAPKADLLRDGGPDLAKADVLLVGSFIHSRAAELEKQSAAIRQFAEAGGRVVVLEQDRPITPIGLDVPRFDGLGGSSTAFRCGRSDFIGWRDLGPDSRLLRRFNGPTGAVVRGPVTTQPGDDVLAMAAQGSTDLDWPVVVRRPVGKGEIIFCQLVLAEHLSGSQTDPVAQTILLNLLDVDPKR